MQPPSSPLVQGEPLYEAFYGFREQPFALSTDPRFLFLSASHRRAYEELSIGLRRREGILLLTGETGTGKTTLCRAVLDALGHRTFSALILNPYMSDAEVLRVILRDFGLVSRDEIRRGALTKADMPQLLDTLEGFLRSLLPLNSYAVVFIDEAQSLAPVVLDQVRITRRTLLTPLPPDEVAEYIRHRLTIAGGGEAVRFEPEAVALINDLSRGLPRRVNLLCDRALEEGRLAGSLAIGPDLVRRAARAIAGGTEPAVTTLSTGPEPEASRAAPARPEAEVELTFGQRPDAPRRSRAVLVVGIALLLLASLVAAGGYAYTLIERGAPLPPLPPEPQLDIGDPPAPVPVPPLN